MQQLVLDIGLVPGPTLDSFFAGPNEAALRHLQLWTGPQTSQSTRSPVPTYLWGPGGSGKTHLLKAVREALREQGATVGWLDASVFEPPEFNEAWAAVLLDEVHLYNSEQQHAAFNWFVNAQTWQRWVLGAGELPPADLPLRDDLRTRLGWGHVFALQPLGEAERRAVLRKQADARGLFLGDEVMDFMLNRFSRDLGSLMQLLDHLDRYALQTQRGITVPMIKSMLETL
ncbi:DnaA regulatory inactivator Hda [Rhodoferax koreense]|uniref:DnaA regulatory inactivator Hda n=1 Tax=Rhodoferax koreensis TaxID=1842727 RepID=A0A1P8JUQ5_9BURK|nr:DnaA regulatory inactivator Hda [Rhodoferax koreense]APW37482.1 DnaA regulatory inactivator Hda [Rhodoferax koreense]